MKVVIGIVGVASGLALGVAIFTLGGVFGFAVSENRYLKNKEVGEETDSAEEE